MKSVINERVINLFATYGRIGVRNINLHTSNYIRSLRYYRMNTFEKYDSEKNISSKLLLLDVVTLSLYVYRFGMVLPSNVVLNSINL